MKRLLPIVLFLSVAASVHAQLVIDNLGPSWIPTDAGAQGQSFLPSSAGSFPTSSAYLTHFQFYGAGGGSAYLSIYSDLGAFSGDYSGYVGSSTNAVTLTSGSLVTFDFAYLELDTSTTYYALFSNAPGTEQSIAGQLFMSSGNFYAGGTMIYDGSPFNGDAIFSATFETAPAVVPEPATYASLAGLVALALVAKRRWKKAA